MEINSVWRGHCKLVGHVIRLLPELVYRILDLHDRRRALNRRLSVLCCRLSRWFSSSIFLRLVGLIQVALLTAICSIASSILPDHLLVTA